jgi:ATP-binding cassette, subfamily B, bacterial
VGSIATALAFDLRVGLVALALSALALLVNLPLTRPLTAASREVQVGEAGVLSAFAQLLQGASIVRYFNLAAWITGRVGAQTRGLARAGTRLAVLEGLRTSTDTIDFAITVGVVLYGGRRCLADPSFTPHLIALVQITGGISVLFAQIGGVVGDVRIRLAAAERVVEVLDLADEPPRLPAPADAGAADPGPGLALDRVSFTYEGAGQAGVRDISLAIRPGQRVALVGVSGGGKSTIFKLVLGLLAPEAGTISLDGRRLYDEDLSSWRKRCAYVSQDPYLFPATVYDNLTAGGPDPGLEVVTRAAKLANAHEFIAALPQGYQTLIGEGAARFSGGQRQRLLIARAVLQDARVLLLDESSSAIDQENERAIDRALRGVMRDRATLVIAHRLAMVRDADEICCIEGGRVVERGSHEALMAVPGGHYRRLIEAEHVTPVREVGLMVTSVHDEPVA